MITPINSVNYNYSTSVSYAKNRIPVSFKGNISNTIYKPAVKTKNIFKTLALSALLALGVTNLKQNTVSGTIDSQNITYVDVKPENKDIIVNTLAEYRSKLEGDTDFLKDVNVVLVDKFYHLDNNDEFFRNVKQLPGNTNTKGVSFYSDGAIKKQIVIQERAHNDDKIRNFIKIHRYSYENSIKHSLMHEVGHQFDSYFGHNHNEKFAKNWDNLLAKMYADSAQNPFATPKNMDDIKIKLIYHKYNGLSDKEVFQKAILKDLQNIAKIKNKNRKQLPSNIDYFVTGINFSKEITPEIVDLADFCRSEVYANLFSYANNQDDGDREKFIKLFENSYKVVQQDIKMYLQQ